MMLGNMSLEELHETQQNSIFELLDRLENGARQLKAHSVVSPDLLRSIEFSNVFGVVGPRGAGKSTILVHAFQEAKAEREKRRRERASNSHRGDDTSEVLFIPAIDCSVIPACAPLGTVVLSHLKKYLSHETVDPCSREWFAQENVDTTDRSHLERLDHLASVCARSEEGYQELCLELSSSPTDYTTYLRRGIEERLELWKEMFKMLKKLTAASRCDAICVMLDDFDIVPDALARRWLFSLLDELRQPFLIFMLAADYYRLQHIVLDSESGIDDKTGRALLQKIMPPQHIVNLDPWPPEGRLSFFPLGSPQSRRPLQALVEERCNRQTIEARLLWSLLPCWPRGLNNLYTSLEEPEEKKRERSSADTGSRTTAVPFKKVLAWLATARGEPLLARDLSERDFDEWLQSIRFVRAEDAPEDWQETVEAAMQRAEHRKESSEPLRPMRGLTPVPIDRSSLSDSGTGFAGSGGTFPGLDAMPPGAGSAEDVLADSSGYGSEFGHDPTWRDPLRHDLLWRRPMRDADPAAKALWVEILVNRSFRPVEREKANGTGAARRRVVFTQRWWPLRTRMESAVFEAALSGRVVREFFADWEGSTVRAALSMITWDPALEVEARIGWMPLLDALRGARDPLLVDQRNALLIPNAMLEGKVQKGGSVEALSVLPDELWAMVLLVDSLDRCPWRAYSGPTGFQLRTYLMLAGALVRSAYLFAMRRSGAFTKAKFSREQGVLLTVLDRRDPSELFQLDRGEPDGEGLLKLVSAVLTDNLDLSGARGPLARAARSFLKSPVYKALQVLAGADPR